ncbi:uncharacterized protein PgNI_09182 [Pyricularia grisea]|uniref:Uncharacterized protein n=1 Tax=Pyricularia grisea TaxID=148305 RepID=A0A6P8ATM1_PYRGI|nr:uncharacterized protein PgNI_09182 [Pyricularia grisea]TLD05437.1 hypothetical protein PgNI_09182 [Pyricularia grisea]
MEGEHVRPLEVALSIKARPWLGLMTLCAINRKRRKNHKTRIPARDAPKEDVRATVLKIKNPPRLRKWRKNKTSYAASEFG